MKTLARFTVLAVLAMSTFAHAGTVYDSKSSAASIAADKLVKEEIAVKVYPADPTPAYMTVNSVCTGKNAFGCTSGGGAGAAAASSGE